MDDLISRRAVLEYMKGWKGETVEYVRNLPSVPAVPLDKLCELLGKSPVHPCQMRITPCVFEAEGQDAECKSNAECWKEAIVKWMEGLDE